MGTRAALEQELLDTIQFMEQEHLVDHRLKQVYSMKEHSGPFFIVELIPTYITDAQNTLTEMAGILEQPVIDYYQLDELCLKLKGGTSSIGAYHTALACGEFRRAVANRSKEECIQKLDVIKTQFFNLKEKMDVVLELERKIISHEYVDP